MSDAEPKSNPVLKVPKDAGDFVSFSVKKRPHPPGVTCAFYEVDVYFTYLYNGVEATVQASDFDKDSEVRKYLEHVEQDIMGVMMGEPSMAEWREFQKTHPNKDNE